MIGEPGVALRCFALAIDTGYAERLDEVYEFGRQPGVTLVKGQQRPDYATRPSRIEHLPRGGTHPLSLVLYHVNTDLYKSKVHRLSSLPAGSPGEWHLNADTTDEYCKQFTNEHQVWENVSGRKGGRRRLVWRPKTMGARVDDLDCEVYSAALADILNVAQFLPDSSRPPGGIYSGGAASVAPPPRKRPKPKPAGGGSGGGPPGGGFAGGGFLGGR